MTSTIVYAQTTSSSTRRQGYIGDEAEHDIPLVDFETARQQSASMSVDRPSELNATVVSQLAPPPTRRRQVTVLISAFLTVFITIGINQTYGVYLEYYTKINAPGDIIPVQQASNKALVAFVGTFASGLTWSGSIIINPLMARCPNYRVITIPGAIIMSLGYFLASFSSQIWHLFLCQGLIYRLGSSMVYFPILAVAPEYFDAHRGAAMGFVVSGNGFGGLLFSPITRLLIDRVGIRWTLRCLGLIMLTIALPIAWHVAPSRSSQRRPTLVDVRIARKPALILQAIATMAQSAGYAIPIVYISEFSTSLGYTAIFGATFLSIFNAVNTFGRISMGYIADMTGRQNVLILTTLLSSITVAALWISSANQASHSIWIAFIILYGLFSAGYNALFPTTVSELFGTQAYASINGFLYFIRGLGATWGPPIGGLMIPSADGKPSSHAYTDLIWYNFALLALTTVLVAAVRGFDAVDKQSWKWKA